MAFSDAFLTELRQRNDIRSVVSQYIQIKGTGNNPKGLCPFHGEKTPSFTLYTNTDSFYCFGCGAAGDVIKFIMMIENLDYGEAVKLLAERSGLTVPIDGVDDSYLKLKNTILSINKETAKFYHNYLMSEAGKEGYEYLKERKLADATIKHFGIGFAPAGWSTLVDHLKSLGYRLEDMITANVAMKGKNNSVYDFFRHRIIFPVIDLRGNIIAFSGRQMPQDDTGRKYMNTTDTPVWKKSKNLFAMNFAKDHCKENLILCEGQLDVIALHQAGFENAVAPLGTAFTSDQAQLMSKYTQEVVITMDADGAGKKATDKAIAILNNAELKTRVIRIPDGKDPDEFMKTYKQEGPARFKALLDGATSDIEYQIAMAADGLDTTTGDGITKHLENSAYILANVQSKIQKDYYAGTLAAKYGIKKDSLLDRIEQISKKLNVEKRKKEQREMVLTHYRDNVNPDKVNNFRAGNAEEAIIAILINSPSLLKKCPDCTADIFVTGFNKKIFSLLYERITEGKEISITHITQSLTDEEGQKLVAICAKESTRPITQNELQNCVEVLKKEKIKKEFEKPMDSDEDFQNRIKKLAKLKTKKENQNGN